MPIPAVHWHEGMFLRPQHFQTDHRRLSHQMARSGKWDCHYNWGLRSLELDLDALANYRLVLRSLKARLRDGTLVDVPDDGNLGVLDLKNAFGRDNSLTVYLAVPVLQLSRSNISGGGTTNGARFAVDTLELEDENTGLNPQPVQVRRLKDRIFDALRAGERRR